MTPLFHGLFIISVLLCLCLAVFGTISGAMIAVRFDDRYARQAGVVVACLSFALFLVVALQIPALVLG